MVTGPRRDPPVTGHRSRFGRHVEASVNSSVKIGIPLFMLRPEQMAPIAERAEALGFESVWVAEHLVFPTQIHSRYPYAAEGVPPINPATPLLDPLLVLMQIAARTERIRLGTNVYILPLRHPLIVARMTMRSEERRGG